MIWQFVSKKLHKRSAQPLAQQFRFRPKLDGLEDRTLLTVHVFTLDPTQSSLTLSGTIETSLGNGTLMQQGPGSLTTTYEGTVAVDVGRFASSIAFLGSNSSVVADNSGSWQPLPGGGSGSAPANYGGQTSISFASALAAVRSLTVTASTNAEPMTPDSSGTGYDFTSDQTLSIVTGNLDYHYSAGIFGSGGGTTSVAGYSAQNQASHGYIFGDGVSQLTLQAPIAVTYTATFSTPIGNVTATLHINGQIVGHSTFPSVVGGFGIGDASLGTALPLAKGGTGLVSLATTNDTLSSSTDGLAGTPARLSDSTGMHAFLSNPTAVDSLAISDGLAVELFS
jgi:hypothetical protein